MTKYLWLAAALLVSACTSQPAQRTDNTAAVTGNPQEATQAIMAAEAAVKQADGVGFAWRDSEDLIKKAREAEQKKDYATAVKLAKSAEKQGNLAYQQYLDQTSAAKR